MKVHKSADHFRTVDCNEELPFANSLEKRTLRNAHISTLCHSNKNAMVSRPGVITIQIISNLIMLVHITIFSRKKSRNLINR